jgi:2-polyprenyl-3-methyl-5-hydroxy-6-metoxy-1,4-benzoquinol methylase
MINLSRDELMQDKRKWDDRYTNDSAITDAAALLRENLHLLKGGKALDVAMGTGSNAVLLAAHGFEVEGVDISSVAVTSVRQHAEKNGLAITAIEADLTNYQIQERAYDVIVDFYYLDRNIIPQLKQGIKTGGLIFFETYTEEQCRFGGISNPDYLLKPNELLFSFLDFFIIFYHERIVTESHGSKAIASLIAQKI